jgi:hypothetical protein
MPTAWALRDHVEACDEPAGDAALLEGGIDGERPAEHQRARTNAAAVAPIEHVVQPLPVLPDMGATAWSRAATRGGGVECDPQTKTAPYGPSAERALAEKSSQSQGHLKRRAKTFWRGGRMFDPSPGKHVAGGHLHGQERG